MNVNLFEEVDDVDVGIHFSGDVDPEQEAGEVGAFLEFVAPLQQPVEHRVDHVAVALHQPILKGLSTSIRSSISEMD